MTTPREAAVNAHRKAEADLARHELGRLLLLVAERSIGGYVLLRRSSLHDKRGWCVNVRSHDREEHRNFGGSPGMALYRAAYRLVTGGPPPDDGGAIRDRDSLIP